MTAGDGEQARGSGVRLMRALALFSVVLGILATGVGMGRSAGAWAIVRAPNYDQPPRPMVQPPTDVTRALRAEVGPPSALLEAWVLDPDSPPRGTVLVLHGVRDDKRSMIDVGRALRDRGMRAVLVDLRGHGGSSGQFLTYGVLESQDLSHLLDHLDALNMLAGPVSVLGASYGGAVGIQLSARDARVRAVASLSTFASLREVVPPQARVELSSVGWLLPDRVIDLIVDDAGELGGFSPDAADTRVAITRTGARVLLVHGREDRRVPYEHARALLDSCPVGQCALVSVSGDHAAVLGSPEAHEAALDFLSRWGT
ncbi:MAG: alpha/beta hydrolase [Sandaracinaceae bacterium]